MRSFKRRSSSRSTFATRPYYVPESKRDRLATIYRATLDKGLTPLPEDRGSKTFFAGRTWSVLDSPGLHQICADVAQRRGSGRGADAQAGDGGRDDVQPDRQAIRHGIDEVRPRVRTRSAPGIGRRSRRAASIFLGWRLLNELLGRPTPRGRRRGDDPGCSEPGMWSSRGYVGTSSSPSVMPRLNRVIPSRSARTAGTSWTRTASPCSGWAPRSGSSSASTSWRTPGRSSRRARPRLRLRPGHADGRRRRHRAERLRREALDQRRSRSRPTRRTSRTWTPCVRIARENNLNISMTLYHQRYRKRITLEKARAWAQVAGASGTRTCRTSSGR